MIALIQQIWAFVTLKSWRARREAVKRRRNYDAIKGMIVKEHLDGRGGLVLDKRKFDLKDLESFKAPMYQIARTHDQKPVIFWRKELMTEEIGPPLKDGA